MRKTIIILCTFFLAVCVVLAVISPDYLSMAIVGVMGVAIGLGLGFGLIPNLLYCVGLRNGQNSIDRVREVNADNIWTAVANTTPFFKVKHPDVIIPEKFQM